mmetsp:Transcript_24613/g.48094  ORF Transcript_24613/g.48094 Transcript_24613/m.48094 type:complete len:228 (+) Transcript_24613:193-876(+)
MPTTPRTPPLLRTPAPLLLPHSFYSTTIAFHLQLSSRESRGTLQRRDVHVHVKPRNLHLAGITCEVDWLFVHDQALFSWGEEVAGQIHDGIAYVAELVLHSALFLDSLELQEHVPRGIQASTDEVNWVKELSCRSLRRAAQNASHLIDHCHDQVLAPRSVILRFQVKFSFRLRNREQGLHGSHTRQAAAQAFVRGFWVSEELHAPNGQVRNLRRNIKRHSAPGANGR